MSETTTRAAMTDLISDLCDKHGLRAFRDQIAGVIRPATDITFTPSSMDERFGREALQNYLVAHELKGDYELGTRRFMDAVEFAKKILFESES
jgi:hypothetical protein